MKRILTPILLLLIVTFAYAEESPGVAVAKVFTVALGVFCMIYLLADKSVNPFAEFIFPTGIVCILIVLLGIKILRGRSLFAKSGLNQSEQDNPITRP